MLLRLKSCWLQPNKWSLKRSLKYSMLENKPYYERHIFFCLNERKSGEVSCAQHHAQAGFDRCKMRVKQADLSGKGQVRVNKAGCLDRCAGGPVAVVYPEGVWYSFVDNHDIDEIVESHLKNGQVVERLRLPDAVGR
jgi:(2Fe-2S) ferredoxin